MFFKGKMIGVFAGGDVDSVVSGDNINVDNTDPINPVVNLADDVAIAKSFALARKESGFADLTSSGESILAVTSSIVARNVFIATSDVQNGRQFTIKDEGGLAGSNNITVSGAELSVVSVVSGGGGSNFVTSANHDYIIGQVIFHSTFTNATYNGTKVVTSIVNPTRYEVAAIAFISTDTGITNVAIDGSQNATISANYGAMTVYCSEEQIFSVGI